MNRFLLFTLTVWLLSPLALHAETIWLIIVGPSSMEKIEMDSMDKCEEEGKNWKTTKIYRTVITYKCLKGK